MSVDTSTITESDIREALHVVKDPEIPTVSLVDLGLITRIEVKSPDEVEVDLIPTFSGCPALTVMRDDVQKTVEGMGFEKVHVKIDFSITWSTNMISEQGLKDIEKVGLSSPKRYCGELNLEAPPAATCTHCKSERTVQVSPFGPTLCRSIYYCNDCEGTFEQFKPLQSGILALDFDHLSIEIPLLGIHTTLQLAVLFIIAPTMKLLHLPMNTILKPKAYAMAFVVFGLFLCSCSPKLNIKNSTFYIAGSPPVMIQVLPRGTEPMNIDPILYSDVLTSSVMTATLQKGIKTQPVGFEGITTPLNPGDVSVNFMNAQIEELEGIPPASNEAEIPESKGYKMTIDYAYTLVGKKGKEITKSFHTIHSITQQELGKRLRKSPDGDPMRVLIEKAALEVVENIEKEVTQQLEKG